MKKHFNTVITNSLMEATDLAAFLFSYERPVADPDKTGDYHLDPDRDKRSVREDSGGSI